MTPYEQREVLEYPEVWFLGLEAKKIEGVPGAPQNSGYDDENGSYHKVPHDHMAYRYEILEVIGKGSFGQVVKVSGREGSAARHCWLTPPLTPLPVQALDHRTNSPVAIKVIRNKKRFHHQALVEVKILDALRAKDAEGRHNIIHMLDYFYFRNHLCISFELMG